MSDKEATINYLQSTRKLTDKQQHVFNQMYGHLTYIFDGHKIKIVMEPHNIEGYADGSDLFIEESIIDSYYFVRMLNKDSATIFVLPSRFWHLDDLKTIQIEFDSNGFWVEAELLRFIEPPFKEKFTKKANH